MELAIANEKELNLDISWCKKKLRAVNETFSNSGYGEVVVSKRKKESWEEEDPAGLWPKGRPKKGEKRSRKRRRVLHGKAIANIAAKQGRDAFKYTDQERTMMDDWMAKQILEVLERVDHTCKPQTAQMQMIMLWAAQKYETLSRQKIKSRQFKANTEKYMRKKLRMVELGLTMNQYGSPPPPLVLTGRFLRGIRSRWRQGPQQGSSSGGIVASVIGAFTGRIS